MKENEKIKIKIKIKTPRPHVTQATLPPYLRTCIPVRPCRDVFHVYLCLGFPVTG